LTRDSWIAIDFETATSERNSICAVGIAVIRDGVLDGSGSWLIQPPGNAYSWHNTAVHGITARDTSTAPTFSEFYSTLWPYLDNQQLVAHWASFDISVLRSAVQSFGLPSPSMDYTCTCRMARRAFPELENHKLPTVSAHCGIGLEHHDAGSDAHACALVALSCRDRIGAPTIGDALDMLGMKLTQF
jgi:DNA polymerase III subunit epsilon